MKFSKHIDHVTWVTRPENIERNVALFSSLFDVEFDGPWVREDMGFKMYLCWESGFEIVCPLEGVTPFNKTLHDRLETHGEGMLSIVFGVKDLEATRERLEKAGFSPGELWGEHPQAPWRGKVSVKERDAGFHLNTWVVFGEIDYADGVVAIT